jgi:hypothetical protein
MWPVKPARLPEENRPGPFTGYKLAHPVLSADGGRGAFLGLGMSARQVYGAEADAICLWGRRHSVPDRRCQCGFYCFHTLEQAEAMAMEESGCAVVVLEVAASGRFIRYEQGLRYARQRVRGVMLGRCRCGAPGELLVHSGPGLRSWRRLHPSCALCCRRGPALSRSAFGELVGGLPVYPSEPVDSPDDPVALALLSAEVALLQARLDEMQRELHRIATGVPTAGARSRPFGAA